MSEERGNDSLSKMSLSEKQRERSDSEVSSSESVKSDQSKGDVPYFTEETPTKSERSDSDPHVSFNEETPSQSKSERSGSPVFSSVSMKSDHSKGDGPNFSENKTSPAKSERSGSPVFSSVSMKSDHSKGDGPNFSENKTSPAKSERSGPHVSFSEATPSQIKSERSGSPVFSSVSMKSDHSKGDGPNFSENKTSPAKSQRLVSYESSSVSVKSDHSKGDGPNFSEKKPSSTKSKKSGSHVSFSKETPSRTKSVRSDSHVSSSVSVKSDHSKGDGPNFSEKTPSKKSERSGSHVSFVSVKSDHSKGDGPNFNEKTPFYKSVRSGSHVSSFVSMKSDHSKGDGPNFSEETPSPSKSNRGQKTTVNIGAEFSRWKTLKAQKGLKSDVELATFLLNRVQFEKSDSDYKNYRNRKDFRENLLWIFKAVENKILIFLKNELEKFKKILKKENTQYFVQDFIEEMRDVKEAALDMTLFFLRDMKQVEAADALQDELVLIHQRPLKSNLKKKHQSVSEGIAKHGDSKLLNNIYTDLYMTLGAIKQVNTQHEVRQVQVADRRHESQEIAVECKNLFKAPEQDKEIRTVLTKGVAGIGKSISVQKFIVDWAEGKENKDITFIFPLAFREMNLKEKEKQSLTSLISQFFPEIKGLNLARNDKFKFLFILDGLDECRLPLNFDGNETCRDVSSPVSLDVLLTNLIKGNLLPSALIWITTRPAAAIKIPPECIDRVTEVQGFNDAQKKEEYFRKRFTDVDLANEIIDNVKQSKSLFIMCYIPVFCWISATVLQNILEEKRNNDLEKNKGDDTSKTLQESNTEDTPRTLTQMYTHFLRFQILQSRRKYEGKYTPNISWDKDAILSLGKLAFHQLQRNNLLFYNTDLESCGIDASKASVYSGMCTQIFKEEKGIILGTTFCFVHLSIQEFIAALYAHLFLDINKKSVFVQESTKQENKNEDMIDLLKTAVDKALESDTGHLDLFLRFLLGLSLQTNRPLLRGLLTQQDDNDQSNKEIVQYIKQKLEENLSPERSINLFYCLNELNDQTLVKAIQTQLREGSLSSADLSPAQWSAVAFVLLTSEEEMKEFELQKFKKSDECLFRLLEVVKISKRAVLNDCNITDKSCSSLAKALESDNNLKELIMDSNNLQDAGVRLLCAGLNSVKCKLEILRLSKCDLTEESCLAIASVLSSDSSSLKDLDLSDNNLKDSGVKLLSDGLKENCKLENLRLSGCSITEEGYKSLASALRSNPSHLIELDLRGNDPGQSGVKELSDLLQDPNCKLTMRFLNSDEADEACKFLTRDLSKNPLLLRELNVSDYKLDLKKVKQLAALLVDKHCKLNIIQLNNNGITADGCAALTSALISNPSNLTELDLSGNKLGKSGVEHICHLLANMQCTLKKLKLSYCSITGESYKTLVSVLESIPLSHLIELDLTGNYPGRFGLNWLFKLLGHGMTISFLSPAAKEACEYLTNVLGTNPLLLQELDLSSIKLGDMDWEKISALLVDSHCIVEKIKLNNCELTNKSCSVLATVLSKNNNLKEMDLNNSRLLYSGVKQICEGLKNTVCKLKILKLSNCSISEEGYKALASALSSNPSHLIELDLTGNDPGQSGVKEFIDLLQNRKCSLKKLSFLEGPAAEAYQYLTEVLGIKYLEKPLETLLFLRDLNLSEHKLGDTGVNQIAVLLQDKHCKPNTLMLRDCGLTEKSCSTLATVLRSNSSLKKLDISNNNLQDSGVKKLQNGLENTNCKLKTLRLSNCSITEEGYKALASALRSNPSHLRELDLTGNYPGRSGVKEISDLLQDGHNQLKTIRFLKSHAAQKACDYLTKVLGKSPLLLTELDLSEDKLGDLDGEKLSALLMDSHSKLEKMKLNNCELTEKSCSVLATVLSSKTILKELNLNNNHLLDSGVKEICEGLKNPVCKLRILKLSNCSVTEEGYKALASSLRSNPSHLIELDLTGNDPGQSGVKELNDLLQDPNCQLKTLRFLGPVADEACQYVTGIVGNNPLLLRELNLSERELGDSNVKKLAALLQDKHCKLNTLILSNCSVTEEGYKALASSLRLNPSHLIELDLRGNDPGQSGVKELNDLLQDPKCQLKTLRFLCPVADEACEYVRGIVGKDPLLLRELNLSEHELGDTRVNQIAALLQDKHCKLNTLILCGCSITEKQCLILTSALKSNLSYLRELDLSENKLQNKGVNILCDVLKDSHCKLERLRLRYCGMTSEGCSAVTSALNSNPSHLRELNLSANQLGFENLGVLLRNPKFKLEILVLCGCSITEKQCLILTSALKSNPLHMRELDLSENELKNTGVKHLCDILYDSQCKLERLRFRHSDMTDEGCSAVTSALKSNPSHLRELDLSENHLGESGVKNLCDLLRDKQCNLEKLDLCRCSITEKQCLILTLGLCSNLSHLRELSLSGNELKNTGVNHLCDVLKDSHCKLERLRLKSCDMTDEGCSALTSALKSNSSHLRELELSGNKIKHKGMKHLCDILKDSDCKLERLSLKDCGITDVACLAHALSKTKALHCLKELDLSKNKIGNSKKQLSKVLKDSNCNLRLDSEETMFRVNLNSIGGWFSSRPVPIS
ncbi:protein NLRC5-like isoform X20 [Ctenopharyngodon idella]|uniref:protein NLRC5-like isoform X20 n=1 Tax=Ctenopharyngodon idella TaxID=7959 RepID=UPI00222FFE5A|nr:protein NLRC5-like isoform X20 [Ctenopharyngodon idella]